MYIRLEKGPGRSHGVKHRRSIQRSQFVDRRRESREGRKRKIAVNKKFLVSRRCANTKKRVTRGVGHWHGRTGKTCSHNVGPTTRQLLFISFIIKREPLRGHMRKRVSAIFSGHPALHRVSRCPHSQAFGTPIWTTARAATTSTSSPKRLMFVYVCCWLRRWKKQDVISSASSFLLPPFYTLHSLVLNSNEFTFFYRETKKRVAHIEVVAFSKVLTNYAR